MRTKIKPTRSTSKLEPTLAKTAPVAFASILTEIRAVPPSAIPRNNLDMSRAARRGLGVADRLAPLLPELLTLSKLDVHAVTNLRTRALAVLHADELVREGGAATTAHLAVLLAEAMPLRELMLSAAESLAVAGYVTRARVAAIRSGKGHANTATGLQALGRLYRELWEQVHDKVPVKRAMVDRAIVLSAELQEALGIREIDEEQPQEEPREPAHVRGQAFALFCRAYEECRRGVTYLRWHEGDAGVLVPSLYPRHWKARPEAEAASEADATEGDASESEVDVGANAEAGKEAAPVRIVA